MEHKLFKALKVVLITLFWFGIWELVSILIGKPLLFPSPIDVIKKLFELILTSQFWKATLLSLCRVGLGIIIAIIIGFLIGILCSFSSILYSLIAPLVTVIKATPVASFIVLFIVLIVNGSEITPIIISALMVFPIVFSNVYQGIKSIDNNLLEVCKIYNIPFKRKMSALYIPSLIPYVTASLLSSIGLGLKAGIAAEVLCIPKTSIGFYLFEGKTYFDNVDVFAWTIPVIIISLILEKSLTKLLNLIFKKYVQFNGGKNGN